MNGKTIPGKNERKKHSRKKANGKKNKNAHLIGRSFHVRSHLTAGVVSILLYFFLVSSSENTTVPGDTGSRGDAARSMRVGFKSWDVVGSKHLGFVLL